MNKFGDWNETIEILDVCLLPIAKRPLDLNDSDWLAKLKDGPDPLDEAGVRSETEILLEQVVQSYLEGDAVTRNTIRELFAKYPNFTWAARLPFPPTTAESFRSHLILFAINDQGRDSRDAILLLQDICEKAGSAGVHTSAIMKEVALLCSDQDRYGMGSTRSFLLNRVERG